MLVEYGYYHEYYFGDLISEGSWPKYEARAVTIFHRYTFNRLKGVSNVQEDVKMCICELADTIHEHERIASMSAGITSESVDGHSVTYATSTSLDRARELKEVCRKHLSHTGLMYPGAWHPC